MRFPWVKRSDLIAVPHDGGGWVVKDPLTLQYALLEDHEYSILNLMDGRTGFRDLLANARKAAPWLNLTAEDLAEFIRSLAGSQLVRQQAAGDSVRLSPAKKASSFASVLQFVLQLIRIQIRLLNPTRFIDRAMPLVSTLFSRSALVLFSALIVSALVVVTTSFGKLIQSLPALQEFLGPQNMALMLGVFVAVKILHEAGHAFTARRFGAECSECGIMFMVFTPVLYTNVSDSWLLPRQQRLLVTGAGIIVELTIAAVCTILWWFAAPGLTKSILLNTMILCSVNTLLFNGNPLLRFDGYFLLADWMGIPNLAGRSSAMLREAIVSFITGRTHSASQARVRNRRFLLLYGVVSAIYRLFLTLAILKLVDEVTRQWNVRFLGSFLFIVIAGGFILMPAASFLQSVRRRYGESSSETPNTVRVLLCIACLIALLLFPLPRSIVAPAFVQPASTGVYASLSGRLDHALAYGTQVEAQDVVARFEHPELNITRHRLKARRDELKGELELLGANPATSDSTLIPALQKRVDAAEERLADFEVEYSELTVISQRAGTFLPPEAIARPNRTDVQGTWHGRSADAANQGAWIERGTLLGYVGERSEVSLLVAVDEGDIEFVRRGQSLVFSPAVDAEVRRTGRVEDVGLLESRELPLQFAASRLVAGRTTESALVPSAVTYLCTATLTGRIGGPPSLYSTGRVRINVASASILDRVVRYLKQTF